MDQKGKKYDLEDRLVDFACLCLTVCDILPSSKSGQSLHHQLSRSATASALIYGEAQAAESNADFIHKMKMVLKEIRETRVNLKIIIRKPVIINDRVEKALSEANELMAIFLKSIKTARERSQVTQK